MDDSELAAIRAARLSQLQQQSASAVPQSQNPGAIPGQESEEKRAAEEQMRRDMLATVLDHAARERRASLSNLT